MIRTVHDIRGWGLRQKVVDLLLSVVMLLAVALVVNNAWHRPDGLWSLSDYPSQGTAMIFAMVLLACLVLFFVPFWSVYDGLRTFFRRRANV